MNNFFNLIKRFFMARCSICGVHLDSNGYNPICGHCLPKDGRPPAPIAPPRTRPTPIPRSHYFNSMSDEITGKNAEEKFINELVCLCKKYNVSFIIEEIYHSLVVTEGCDQKFIDWLMYKPTPYSYGMTTENSNTGNGSTPIPTGIFIETDKRVMDGKNAGEILFPQRNTTIKLTPYFGDKNQLDSLIKISKEVEG